MKIGLYTVDLFPGRERLMPFRTLLEVAKVMKRNGWDADVLNSCVLGTDAKDFEWQGVKIVQCPRDFSELSFWVNERSYDVFFFAATIREGLRDLSKFSQMSCRKIAYVPSGITPKQNALKLFCLYGMFAKAWMLEAFTPKTWIGKKLKKTGFESIIGLTGYTSHKLGNILPVVTIYPGKDDFEHILSDDSIVVKNGMKGKKFYLFTGAPGQVRGSQLLLKAFDQFAEKEAEKTSIVFLMRNDVGAHYDLFFETLKGMRYKDNVTVLRDQLTVPQLKAFMEEAYAVVLPFICIPAEVPITYYEVMSCDTPVVSFYNAGTTEYLREGLQLAEHVTAESLAKALKELWNSEQLRSVLSVKAKKIMDNHPTWEQVGEQWMKIINQ